MAKIHAPLKTNKHHTGTKEFKVYKTKNLQPSTLARIKQEYEHIKAVDHDGVVKTFDIIDDKDTFTLIQENVDGLLLHRLIQNQPVDIILFLKIAISLSNTLGFLHEKNIIHKAIRPLSIYFNEKTGQVKISNFGIISEITGEQENLLNQDVVDTILPYISPEQTGRINIPIDHRTDLYSLGIVFYEMLTGSAPFKSNNTLEIIHSHIAKKPVLPNLTNPEIPDIISDIIIKLISKSPDERYQNAFGLRTDLSECLKQLTETGVIPPFDIAQKDFSEKIIIPQKLYGRNTEIEIIMSLFDKVAEGENKLLFVTGEPGIGKSALINHIRELIIGKHGYFISGKYEQLKIDEPYSAVIYAFKMLTRQILSESDEEIRTWEKKLLFALGPNGKVITELIPEVELIIGKQPKLIKLGPEESRNRFNYVFERFVNVFTDKKHPVILFLDDLQWSDTASIKLIQYIINSLSIRHLFIIGAYRDNEVSYTHPLSDLSERIGQNKNIINRVRLTAISSDNVKQMIANIFKCSEKQTATLGQLVFNKTGGNPFFAIQFLKILHSRQYVSLNPETGWQWDETKIKEMDVTDNLANLLVDKICDLSEQTREILKIGACIGTWFDLETIAGVTGQPLQSIFFNINEAVIESLINNSGDKYHFQHDKIQEAVYSLIPENEKRQWHYQIGKLELEITSDKELQNKLYYIVDHMNLGLEVITDEESKKLVKLNYEAGKKAKTSAAYELSFNYLKFGLTLLGKKSWETQYNLTLDLYTEALEAAYLCSDFEYVEKIGKIVLINANTLLEKIKVYEIRLKSYNAQNRSLDVIKEGLYVLELLGFKLPKNPNRILILWWFYKIKFALRNHHFEEIGNMDDMTSPKIISTFTILIIISQAAYRALPNLLPIVVLQCVYLSLKYGNAPQTALSFAGYGMILCSKLGHIDAGYYFGQIALLLNERPNAKKFKARALYLLESMILYWKGHLKNRLQPLLNIHSMALEIGDIEFASYACADYCFYSYIAGVQLYDCDMRMKNYSKVLHQFKHETHLNYIKIFHQATLNLLGETYDPCHLKGEMYDEQNMIQIHIKANDETAIFILFFQKMILCYLFGYYIQATEYADSAKKYINSIMGLVWNSIFNFYDSLSRLAIFPDIHKTERRCHQKIIAANQKKMKKWAAHAPMNYLHKFYLVEAERARVNNDIHLAEKHYILAIEHSKKNSYIQEEALANELAGKFHLSRNNKKLAWLYMQEAYECYSRWGAKAKLKHLEDTYPELIIKPQDIKPANSSPLDIASIIRASQAISSEIEHKKLLKRMLAITIENAGAQKGCLIIVSSKGLLVEAEFTAETGLVSIMESIPLETHIGLSSGIVKYVVRTRETIILNNPAGQGEFASDPYIRRNHPKSVLCMPILSKGELSAITYLENNLTENAFTPERIEVLNLLSTQMAISLDNAGLYENLEEKIEERTSELRDALDELEILNKEIAKSRDMKEKQLRLLIDNMKSVVYRYLDDKNQTIAFISEGCSDLLGYEPVEFLNKPGLLKALIHPKDIMDFQNRNQIAVTEKTEYQAEYRIITPSGNEKWIWEQCECVVSDEGDVTLFEGLLIDITDRKLSIAALKESERIKSEFITTASHELRTPLHIMKLGVSGLLDGYSGQISPEVKDDLMVIQMGIDRLMKIMETFLDLTKIEARQSNRSYEKVPLLEIINTSIAAIYGLLRDSGHSLLLNIKAEKHLFLHVDKERLIQVIINLLSNATRYTPAYGVIIILVESDENRLIIKVADNGYGIPKWAQEKVFEKFFQADYVMSHKVGGSGLGLSISQAIVNQHKGKLYCRSPVPDNMFSNFPLDENRNGSIFILELPIEQEIV